ncbi:histidine kinase/DNA gyrase B/HSP90-like ATPase [Gillisia sp. Hel_I_86]|uniref:sensor histidine kinase n=1 Tax=Gillisia sp. Hel_I_86 TaxID=1249981 RepID=UPI00119AF14B|nr:HAMP domain-containing sensor histidine kinase [Gillisia sp. Hel_I_86]TVZ27834.1 histidine kinase/DNA gyrase B/HSP90-like ATPase [Gillisia sp. Hel_I_86]
MKIVQAQKFNSKEWNCLTTANIELKNPWVFANWLLQDNVEMINLAGKEQFKLLLQNVEKMDAQIDGILNSPTIDQAVIDSYPVDLNILTKDIIQTLHIPEHINVTINKTLPIIKGDKFRFQQLFQNLIQNAIKSIDKPFGEIEIDVVEDGAFWIFSKKDSGRGIPQEYHTKIFQIFEKIENDQAATGIGLSIVKKIIDFYNGKLWLESKPNIGSTFFFTLPRNN